MTFSQQIANQFRQVYFGGNWTAVNFKDTLADVDWKQATAKVGALNTIAALVFHTNYYVSAVLNVLNGAPLEAHDKFSFDLPPVQSQPDWEGLLQKTWTDAERFANEMEHLPEATLWDVFTEPKYGTWYRNLHGIIEHNHYHLGQIVLIKKLLQAPAV